jgi:phosphoribosylformylglycinamidine synthase
VALSADGNPLLGLADPYTAGAAAVLEACRNVACVGGVPAAVTDCLNFGNPEVPQVFWQFREAVRGIAAACRGLGRLDAPDQPLPVVSGNVSFYNQSKSGRAVAPSPIIACVGIVKDSAKARTQRFKEPGDLIYLVGRPVPDLGASLYCDCGFAAGLPSVPRPDFGAARRQIAAVIDLVEAGLVAAAHDISDGGLAVTLAEMAMGLEDLPSMGACLQIPDALGELTLREVLFCERGGFVVSVKPECRAAVEEILAASGAEWWPLGEVIGEDRLTVVQVGSGSRVELRASDLARAWQSSLPRLFGGQAVPVATETGEEEGCRPARHAVARTEAAPHRTQRSGRGPPIAVLQLPGVNCEQESARAIADVGGEPEIFRWTRPAAELNAFAGYLLPGGFSYQDRVRAGAVAAKDPLLDVLQEAADRGKPILGICNGCQILVEAGLVPGLQLGAVEVALAANRFPGRRGYHCRWVLLQADSRTRSHFCAGLVDSLPLPIAHAEGRFTHEDPDFFTKLAADGYIALRYASGKTGISGNPNGSLLAAAALTNAQGNVLAMMPHPERGAWLYQVPEDFPHAWGARRRAAAGDQQRLAEPGPGAVLLRRLVELC